MIELNLEAQVLYNNGDVCCKKSEHINHALLLNLVYLSTILFSCLTSIRNLVRPDFFIS